VAGFSLPVVYTVAVEVVKEIDTLTSILTVVSTALIHIWDKFEQIKQQPLSSKLSV